MKYATSCSCQTLAVIVPQKPKNLSMKKTTEKEKKRQNRINLSISLAFFGGLIIIWFLLRGFFVEDYINPTGRFVIGGPLGDSGLTGRKIIVDTYGGYARHGGGAFSGKDATKVDRSAAYMARFLAKNIVANGYAKKCEIQFAYSIGVAKPVSIYIDTFGTNTIPEEEIVDKIKSKFDLTPRGIIEYLDLKKPIYRKTTNYGHFGKEDLSWEKVIKI